MTSPIAKNAAAPGPVASDPDVAAGIAALDRFGERAQAIAKATELPEGLRIVMGALSVVSMGMCAYHGYRRNDDSLFWGAVWAGLGTTFPVFAPAIALAQGFGEPEHHHPCTPCAAAHPSAGG